MPGYKSPKRHNKKSSSPKQRFRTQTQAMVALEWLHDDLSDFVESLERAQSDHARYENDIYDLLDDGNKRHVKSLVVDVTSDEYVVEYLEGFDLKDPDTRALVESTIKATLAALHQRFSDM